MGLKQNFRTSGIFSSYSKFKKKSEIQSKFSESLQQMDDSLRALINFVAGQVGYFRLNQFQVDSRFLQAGFGLIHFFQKLVNDLKLYQ